MGYDQNSPPSLQCLNGLLDALFTFGVKRGSRLIPYQYCGISQDQCPFETCVFGDLPEEFERKFREFYAGRTLADVKRVQPKTETERV